MRTTRTVAVLFLLAGPAGCARMPAPNGCRAGARTETRCSPEGVPETCSQTQRWTPAEERPCAQTPGSVCCLAASAYDSNGALRGDGGAVFLHRCTRPALCVDGGAR